MADLISRPFYEGEPLDPIKLNNILTDLKATYSQANLANQTLEGLSKKFRVVYDCGRVQIPSITKAGEPKYSSAIAFENTAFNSDIVATNPIIVTATVSSNIEPKATVSALVKYGPAKKQFWVGAVADKAISNLTIDWIAIQKIPDTNA